MFKDAIRFIATLEERKPSPSLPMELDALFGKLARSSSANCAFEFEDAIWAAWIAHPDRTASCNMESAISAIAGRNYGDAEKILNDLVAAYPDWAEAWNKRATLYFLQGRDFESVDDIIRTLELEPRHFGALSGFAQICLRHNQQDSALLAFDAVLSINPHLPVVQITRDELLQNCRQRNH
jgi:predicted Zn-dependent protease